MDRIPATTTDERILVVAPTPLDAQFCTTILGEAGLECVVCRDVAVLEAELVQGAGVILLTDAVVTSGSPAALRQSLERQPEWSDIPVIVLAGGGLGSPPAVMLMEVLGNVTVLDRPVRVITLISALRSAIRARRRQYELRDRLHALREAERTLGASERQFRELVETAMEGIWQVDIEGRTTYVNQRMCDMLGIEPRAMIGRHLSEFVDADELPRVESLWGRRLAGESSHGEWRLRRADGSHLWALTSASPIRTETGAVVGAFAMLTDITDRRLAEDELRETSRRKDEFVATLAHELRNPLAPIRHAIEVLRRSPARAAGDVPLMAMMERQVSHMVRLIDELLEVSRVTRGTIVLQREDVEFATVLATALEASKPLMDANGHHVAVRLPDEPVVLSADPVRLAQVFTNILNNAAKFTGPHGEVSVIAHLATDPSRGAVLEVSVRDNGIGIAPEHLPRVFEMFSQAAPAVGASAGGLGIGLALARSLAELHGGTIDAHSWGPNCGSEFVVRLPVDMAQRQAPLAAPDPRPANFTGLRVLVVDDNADAADSLVALLRLARADARAAYDGREGLRVARSWQPDVALLDIGMPVMDGLEVARHMRRDPRLQRTHLVALTGWGKPDDRRRSSDAGIPHHLVKPVNFDELGAVLAEICDQCRQSSDTHAACGTGRRVLVVDDHVDSGESLAILLRHAGHDVVVSHDGRGALAAVDSFRPDVVALDLTLPDIDGYEVARQLRARAGGSEQILIALTGHGGADVTERTRQAGFDHHEVKPVRIDHLLDLISTATPA